MPSTNTSWATARRCRSPSKAPRVTVRDFGRGIPLGKVVDCVSKINTGAKYNDEVFQFSVGLNGVGTKAVNALSKEFLVRSHRDGEFAEAAFKAGKLKNEKTGKDAKRAGRHVHPSSSRTRRFSRTDEFQPELVERRLRHYSYLNTGLKLILQRGRTKFSVAARPDGPGAGGFAQLTTASRFIRRCITRARRWNFASRTATAVTARRFFRSSTANTPATAARI